jgi:hypothetical protein
MRRRKLWIGLSVVVLVPLAALAVLMGTPRTADPMREFSFLSPYMKFTHVALTKYDNNSEVYYSDFNSQIWADSRKVADLIKENLKASDGWTVKEPDPDVPSLVCTLNAPGKPKYHVLFRAIKNSPDRGFLYVHDSNSPISGFRLWVERMREKFHI